MRNLLYPLIFAADLFHEDPGATLITPVGYFSLETGDAYPLYDLDVELADKREATGGEQVELEEVL